MKCSPIICQMLAYFYSIPGKVLILSFPSLFPPPRPILPPHPSLFFVCPDFRCCFAPLTLWYSLCIFPILPSVQDFSSRHSPFSLLHLSLLFYYSIHYSMTFLTSVLFLLFIYFYFNFSLVYLCSCFSSSSTFLFLLLHSILALSWDPFSGLVVLDGTAETATPQQELGH